MHVVYKPTGEVRKPLKNEWFSHNGQTLQAFMDFQEKEFPILLPALSVAGVGN